MGGLFDGNRALRVSGRGEGVEQRPVGFAGIQQGPDPVFAKLVNPNAARLTRFTGLSAASAEHLDIAESQPLTDARRVAFHRDPPDVRFAWRRRFWGIPRFQPRTPTTSTATSFAKSWIAGHGYPYVVSPHRPPLTPYDHDWTASIGGVLDCVKHGRSAVGPFPTPTDA